MEPTPKRVDTDAPGILVIAGPTASGKSALALALAERLGGEIVNADAMQVYRDLAVLTARPAPPDLARAPHHLFGHVDAAEVCSVGRWRREAAAAIADIRARGAVALLVGGTGLYLHALLEGLADIPEIPADVRARVRDVGAREGAPGLRARAERLDPDAARAVAGADVQRLARILEVAWATGRPLSAWRRDGARPLPPGSWRAMVIEPPRAALYARIDARVEAMAAAGGGEEAARLWARGLSPELPAMKALGVRGFAAARRGEASWPEVIAELQRDTRRYAKRQLTWLRGRAADWPRLSDPQLGAALAALGLAPR